MEEDYKKLYLKTKEELIEVKQLYKQLRKRYENISNELLMYYIKYGKEGRKCKK